MGAAVSGNIELMQALVEAGANINAQDEQVKNRCYGFMLCCYCLRSVHITRTKVVHNSFRRSSGLLKLYHSTAALHQNGH
jgi:ankyrin repeat protein